MAPDRLPGFFFRWLLFLLFAVACSQDPPAAEKASIESKAGIIVAMGDSLTEGLGVAEEAAFPALLEAKLDAEGFSFRVINAGVSGETSSGARSRLNWIMSLAPDIVILETGANDGFRGIDPGLVRDNIHAMVTFFQQKGVVVVLAGMRMVTNMGEDYARRFAAVYPGVAAETGAILVPFLLEGVATRPALNQEDGIHPTAEGYRLVVETLYPYVVKAIRNLPPAEGA
jgi:acyl-CoA thioesterase-1